MKSISSLTTKKNQTMNIKKILSDKFDEEKKKTAQTN